MHKINPSKNRLARNKQILQGGCNSSHDWLMSLAMDLVSRGQTFIYRVLID